MDLHSHLRLLPSVSLDNEFFSTFRDISQNVYATVASSTHRTSRFLTQAEVFVCKFEHQILALSNDSHYP
ncbi:unnamed protein product [Haemonchus placei]|uniref:Ovule protein n=1 Tax=Haemonchus placei TaxID=6290 RepID=A0A0N4VS49_HAEPC|nr:unnamed protein product [Haemonchus placei]